MATATTTTVHLALVADRVGLSAGDVTRLLEPLAGVTIDGDLVHVEPDVLAAVAFEHGALLPPAELLHRARGVVWAYDRPRGARRACGTG